MIAYWDISDFFGMKESRIVSEVMAHNLWVGIIDPTLFVLGCKTSRPVTFELFISVGCYAVNFVMFPYTQNILIQKS